MTVQFSSGRLVDGRLVVTPIRTLAQSDIMACPHVILVPDHYWSDGRCRCTDPEHKIMESWGYVWDGVIWAAPDDDDGED